MGQRPFIRSNYNELISLVEHNKLNSVQLILLINEMKTRNKTASKFKQVIPKAEGYLKNIQHNLKSDSTSSKVAVLEEYEKPEVEVISKMGFTDSQLLAFIKLLAGFILIDNEFDDTEEEFINTFFEEYDIDVTIFWKEVDRIIGIDTFAFSKKQIFALKNLSIDKKQFILATLHELSLVDELFHVNEKQLLEVISKAWGLEFDFGRGYLEWSHDQKQIIEMQSNKKIIVNAGPGTGKTATACARISYLIDNGVEPSNIWLLSFTRTAVQELRDRIANFSENYDDISGVTISTVDSRAWYIRDGFNKGKINSLFVGYKLGIKEAVESIKINKSDFVEFFADLEHLVVDEAQDITEPRLELIENLIQLLPETCGVSIFGDLAQAIYGFTDEDDEKSSNKISLNLQQKFIDSPPDKFKAYYLEGSYRTENSDIIDLLGNLRSDLLSNNTKTSLNPSEIIKNLKEKVDTETLNIEGLSEDQDKETLVLFRKRSEVLQALSFLVQKNISFRVRMSGLPSAIMSWIGYLFFEYEENIISKEDFFILFKSKEDNINSRYYHTKEYAFYILSTLAGTKKGIDIKKLRNFVAQSTPPIIICNQDLGINGPIIGTIHASKGREADNVKLLVNDTYSKKSSVEEKGEEARILFVGASRPKNSLSLGDGYISFAKNLNSGRTYRVIKKTGNQTQTEIGRNDDFNLISIVNEKYNDEKKARLLQENINNFANLGNVELYATCSQKDNWNYHLYEKSKDVWLGTLNQNFNKDLFTIRKLNFYKFSKGRLPTRINYLYMIGSRTVGITEEDKGFDMILPFFQKTKLWTAPIIIGFPSIYF